MLSEGRIIYCLRLFLYSAHDLYFIYSIYIYSSRKIISKKQFRVKAAYNSGFGNYITNFF